MSAASESSSVRLLENPKRNVRQPIMTSDARLGWVLAVILLVGASLLAVFFAAQAIAWSSEPFVGARTARSLVVNGSLPVSGETWAALDAGIRRLDRITAINGENLGEDDAATARYRAILSSSAVGDSLDITFERHVVNDGIIINNREVCAPIRDGQSVTQCQVAVTLTAFPSIDLLASFIIPFVSGLITLGIGVITFALRPMQPGARALASVAALTSVFMTGIFDLDTTFQLDWFWMVALVMLGGALVSFALVFPIKTAAVYRNPMMRFAPIGVTLLIAGVMLALHFNLPTPEFVLTLGQIAVGIAVTGAVIMAVMMVNRRRRATSAVVRDQTNTVLIGLGLSLIVGVFWLLNAITRTLLGYEIVPFNTSASMPFLVVPALSMGYAVLQYRTVDTDRILSRSITYGIMLFGLIVSYFLLVLSASLIVQRVIPGDDPVLIAIIIFALALLFIPVRSSVQQRIDSIYFRQRVDYQARVENFGQRVSSLVNVGDILSEFRHVLEDSLRPSSLFIFLPDPQTNDYAAITDGDARTDMRFAPNSPLISYLSAQEDVVYFEPGQPWAVELLTEKPRLVILQTLVIAGIRGSNRLNSFVSIGAPRSGKKIYSFEELRFIQNLSSQITVAMERALVVDSLERRVRELDVLSQVSQAVNFSVDFDALLELIIAQTNKLIDAPHFYITLRDTVANELYHAFFLEGDDRERDKENKRWLIGRDLFSEIVRNGKALRVVDFAVETSKRGAPVLYESPDMRAWMGVPMIAGSRTLGVLSAGTTDPSVTFSDEQLKIFNDVSALAATSIDKARLFAETNVRARQLAVLNDISRQIVASEAKLEELLQLITERSTEILNTEAGSLLLTPDDGTLDLVFRVAIGGSGSDIINVRIPEGRGLVGEVAMSGQHVIVNDVKNDPRWGGELAKGGFQTNNVLAVPLITQDRVIGVLEVLNKRDGGFSPDDVSLLTTFAGQAAVAIENARLFQLTDLQLSQRLKELETMEQIDIELNRSLDLRRVAEITVDYAVANSNAAVGILGLVTGEPPYLEIVYQLGYNDDNLPEGSENNRIPLDRGIVNRVMRTRQAEVVPNVMQDRDYVPSLRGAISQITLPMLAGGTINALLVLETAAEPRLNLAELPFLQRLTEHASVAIANAQLYAELNRANQSKSEFVSFVAHELKNPLTSIRGYSDVLLGGAVGALSDPQRNFLFTIRGNADRMNTLVSDLNDITKLQTDNMRIDAKPMDFNTVIVESTRPFGKQITDKGQRLIVDVEPDLPKVQGDEGRLIQVLINMVSNAHKYTPEDGEITLTAHIDPSLRNAKGRPLPPMLHVQVRDTGIGLSEEDMNKLFTPYFRSLNPLAQEQLGTGLGLTITQGIIERHGGMIWVNSTLGQGTTFHFTVPFAEEMVGK